MLVKECLKSSVILDRLRGLAVFSSENEVPYRRGDLDM